MKAEKLRAVDACMLTTAITLIARPAFAHGEQLVLIAFYDVLVIPWAIAVFLLARRRVLDPVSRYRLRPLTWVAALAAIFGLLPGVMALVGVIKDPSLLSPLILILSGAPSLWYLWKERVYWLALALVLMPMMLTGSCIAMYR